MRISEHQLVRSWEFLNFVERRETRENETIELINSVKSIRNKWDGVPEARLTGPALKTCAKSSARVPEVRLTWSVLSPRSTRGLTYKTVCQKKVPVRVEGVRFDLQRQKKTHGSRFSAKSQTWVPPGLRSQTEAYRHSLHV